MAAGINYANTNSLWGSFLAETLFRLGVGHAVLAPGSRSAPLTIALALHPNIKTTPVLDERSASFFALGLAKRERQPVLLVCTSGTAAANFFPAIIEARESCVPLLVLTADRPAEMRHCSSGQTIDQVKLYGNYPRFQAELALPEPSEGLLRYLRQVLRHACERTVWPVAGPVHLNVPFRDPLAPVPDETLKNLDRDRIGRLLAGLAPVRARPVRPSSEEVDAVVDQLHGARRLLIVAGPAAPHDPASYVESVIKLAARRAAPVLADALSPVRQRGGNLPWLIENYDCLLERGKVPEAKPDLVLRLGGLPTSKRLRQWLERLEVPQLVVEASDQNVDPLHGSCIHVRATLESLVAEALPLLKNVVEPSAFARDWTDESAAIRRELSRALGEWKGMFEGKIAWLLGRYAPAASRIFVSNSTPIRDVEFFMQARDTPIEIFFNRGANGIDGIVSTAMGVAGEDKPGFLLAGELAFLHDQNGLLNARVLRGGLTVLLINNGGGGIFHSLPVEAFQPPFEEYFVTRQEVDFGKLCAAYGISHSLIADWEALIEAISIPAEHGVHVFEIRTDAKRDRDHRARLLRGTG